MGGHASYVGVGRGRGSRQTGWLSDTSDVLAPRRVADLQVCLLCAGQGWGGDVAGSLGYGAMLDVLAPLAGHRPAGEGHL